MELERQMWRIAEVARRLGVNPITIKRWIRSGHGPAYLLTPTGNYLFDPNEVEKWIAVMKSQPAFSSRQDVDTDQEGGNNETY